MRTVYNCLLCEKSNKFFCSDEFCNFYDGHGSVLDSQHYIHPCKNLELEMYGNQDVKLVSVCPMDKVNAKL